MGKFVGGKFVGGKFVEGKFVEGKFAEGRFGGMSVEVLVDKLAEVPMAWAALDLEDRKFLAAVVVASFFLAQL